MAVRRSGRGRGAPTRGSAARQDGKRTRATRQDGPLGFLFFWWDDGVVSLFSCGWTLGHESTVRAGGECDCHSFLLSFRGRRIPCRACGVDGLVRTDPGSRRPGLEATFIVGYTGYISCLELD